MTKTVAAETSSARATSGRRTSLLLAVLLSCSWVVLLTPAPASADAGTCATGWHAGFAWDGPASVAWAGGAVPTPPRPPSLGSGAYYVYVSTPSSVTVPCFSTGNSTPPADWTYKQTRGSTGTTTSGGSSTPAGGKLWRLKVGEASHASWPSGYDTPPPDTSAPTAPTVTATDSGSDVAVTWTGATDNTAVTTYRLAIDGGSWSTLGNVTSYTHTGGAVASHVYEVQAGDAAGNWSTSGTDSYTAPDTPTGTLTITTDPQTDTDGAFGGIATFAGTGTPSSTVYLQVYCSDAPETLISYSTTSKPTSHTYDLDAASNQGCASLGHTGATLTRMVAEMSSANGPVIAVFTAEYLAPLPYFDCTDGDLSEWGGYGGGGAWGASNPEGLTLWELIVRSAEESHDPKLLWKNLQAENPDLVDAWDTYQGWFWAQYDEATDGWTLRDRNGDVVNKDAAGFGGYGGGGTWGIACDVDEDGELDVPAAAPDPGTAVPVIVPVSQPPAPDSTAAPTGSCDFGLLDPSSWLCSLGGLFGQLLDAIRAVLAWLRDLGGFLLGLFVPDLQALQDSFADVDTAWDASGPGQLTGGVTAIAAPVLTMDENMPTTCEGPQFTLPLPQSRSFSMNPLSTCGELTQYILGVVYPLETALIYLGGFFLGLRIVTRPFGMETPGTTQAAAA